MGQAHSIFNRPTPTLAVPCQVCGRKMLTKDDYVIHDGCRGKPKPCDCGEPSMPYPPCAACRGTGRVEGEVCSHCPPGPCVRCCTKALMARIHEDRGS